MKIAKMIGLLIGFTAFCSCYKIYHITVDNDLQQHFMYKVGSYWIYDDSATKNIDCFYVTKTRTGSESPSESYHYDFIVDSILDIDTKTQTVRDRYGWKLKGKQCDMSGQISYESLFTWPFKMGPGDYSRPPTEIKYVGGLYHKHGLYIDDVAQIKGYSNFLGIDWVYVSPSVGIVKMVVDHPASTILKRPSYAHTWNLVRYKLN